MVNIDEMQFGFIPGRGITDAIFIFHQLKEKYIAAKKLLYFAFVEECVIQGMYSNAWSHMPVNGQCNEEFGVGVGVHQHSILSPLLFILVLEACVSSAPVYHGSFSKLMTWCSSQTPKRCVSPSSRHGRLAWKVKGSMSTWRRPSSWSLVLTMMSSRNLASTSVLPAVVVSAETPFFAHSVWWGCTRGGMAWLSDWSKTQTISAPGVRVSLCPSMAEQWLSGCRQHHAWCGSPFLLPGWYAVLW